MTYRVVMDCVDVDLLTMCQVMSCPLPGACPAFTKCYKPVTAHSVSH